MSNSGEEESSNNDSELYTDSSDDDFMDAYLDKPPATGEYLKLLGYCVAGLISVGLILAFISNYTA